MHKRCGTIQGYGIAQRHDTTQEHSTGTSITKKNSYTISRIDKTMGLLDKAVIFSKLNIQQIYHRIRLVTVQDSEYIIFSTAYENYRYLVLLFGLILVSIMFQGFMNEKFTKLFGRSVILYLDDILVFSDSRKEHEQYIRKVLEIFRKSDLQADIKKCKFYICSVKYLDLIMTPESIQMDPNRVRVVQKWPISKPEDLHAVKKFLEFVNFYRRFCLDFSKIARPLNDLLGKDSIRKWNDYCIQAFEELKRLVGQESVLIHFDPVKEIFVEYNISDYIVDEVLSQRMDDEKLYSMTYFSMNMASAEHNYVIYDKELLAIIYYFEKGSSELRSLKEDSIKVFTDYKVLKYFMSTKKLIYRQTYWTELLFQYNFQIGYCPEAANEKADTLIRRKTEILKAKEDLNLYQTLLQKYMLLQKVKNDLEIVMIRMIKKEDLFLWKKMKKKNRLDRDFEIVYTKKQKKNMKKKISRYIIQDYKI